MAHCGKYYLTKHTKLEIESVEDSFNICCIHFRGLGSLPLAETDLEEAVELWNISFSLQKVPQYQSSEGNLTVCGNSVVNLGSIPLLCE